MPKDGGHDDEVAVALPRPDPHGRVVIEISDDESDHELIADHQVAWHDNGDNDLRLTTTHDSLPICGDKPSPIQSPHAYKRAKIEADIAPNPGHLNLNPNRDQYPETQVYRRWHGSRDGPHPFQRGAVAAQPTYQETEVQESGEASSSRVPLNSRLPQADAELRPPYYVDGCFEVKMYNGPGFEQFPVVLGTVKGHQEICNKWDAKETKRLQRKAARLQRELYSLNDPTYDPDHIDQNDRETDASSEFEDCCLESVRGVFPDIEVAFVEKEIEAIAEAVKPDIHDVVIRPEFALVAQTIIDEVLEMNTYPKEDITTSLSSQDPAPDNGTGITITWDRDLEKDAMYLKDAVILVAKTFDHVPTHYIHKVVDEKKSIFNAYVHLHEQEEQFYSLAKRPYARLRNPRKEIEKKYLLTYNDRRIPYQYFHRVNELQAAKQHVAREAIQDAARKEKKEAERINLLWHKENGALAECQCCFDPEIPLNRIVPCMADQQHYFCYACVESLANSQVGMMKHEMRCMDVSGCTADLFNEHVGKAVPILTFDRLEMNRQQAEVMAAGIDGLEKCRWCDYQAICDTVDEDPVFICLNPQCKRATCRKCNKDNHLPKSCEENKRDGELSGRHNIEEARSEAIMRTCPNKKCGVKIIKDFGCNKMECVKCHSKMCYVCKQDITYLGGNTYWHFNKPDAKCPLYDQEGVDRHEQEAMAAELEAIEEAKKVDADVDETLLRVESGKPQKPKLDDHPAADIFYQNMMNRARRLDHNQRRVQELNQRVAIMQRVRPDPEQAAFIDHLIQEGQQQRQQFVHRMRNLEPRMDQNFGVPLHFDENLGARVNVDALRMGLDPIPPPAPPAMHHDRFDQFQGPANFPEYPNLPIPAVAPGLAAHPRPPAQHAPPAQGGLGRERQMHPMQYRPDIGAGANQWLEQAVNAYVRRAMDPRAAAADPHAPIYGWPENPYNVIPGGRRP
ncbi:uncharacterized protein PV06_05355 [Exophiala oligosperma]|uniref:RING-type domain-containing protein n=1 Tax=Exophiala oligosperma TaxID=215243 RepID=A0A0D2AX23_9EURO|nr:uncharacterized protein PV06_05355 [Exophiala oligosperma]KIW44341.1 hypothetical protein PV06_05355 [Exophiala oligosperma]